MNFKQNHLIELWMIVLKLILAIGCSVNRKNKKRDKSKKEDLSRCVPWVGIEPTLCCQNWILNPARLPVPPPRLNGMPKIKKLSLFKLFSTDLK